MKEKLKKAWSKKWVRWVGGIVVVIILGRLIFGGSAPAQYELATVAKGQVVETVSATGQIKPKSYASLRFKATGIIGRILVDVGDTVVSGQTLAVLDTSDLSKKVTQAQADLAAADVADLNAKLSATDEMVKGDQALAVLYIGAVNSFNDILNLSQQSYATFVTFYDSSNHLTNSIASSILSNQRVVDANNAFNIATDAMGLIRSAIENFPAGSSRTKIDAALTAIHQPLQAVQNALNALINAIASIPTGAISATTLEAYKDALATAKSNLNSAISKESTTSANLSDAKIQNTLSLNAKQAIQRSAQADLEKARAALAIAQQSLSDAYLRAPLDGTIAVKSKQIGELVTTADQVYYMLGSGPLEVVSNVPEVDVARLKAGMDAQGTLDALSPDEKFDLIVDSIDPDQTTIDGVVYYRTHFLFKKMDERFKSGMTVNLTLIVNQKSEVLVIPRRAVTQRSGVSTVRIASKASGATPEAREIKVGLKGDLQVEVLSGLTEGEQVIVAEKKQ